VSVVSEMNIKSWEEMKPHLVKVIWVEVFCESPLSELWEVEAKRKVLELVEVW
jgi:hypothetical protein